MSEMRKRDRSNVQFYRALNNIGGGSISVLLLLLGAGIVTTFIGDSLTKIVQTGMASVLGLKEDHVVALLGTALVGGGALFLGIGFLKNRVSNAFQSSTPNVRPADRLLPKVLVFFVSRAPKVVPGSENPVLALPVPERLDHVPPVSELASHANTAELRDLLGSWRMPLTAVAHELDKPDTRLERIILVASCDEHRTASDGNVDMLPGTIHDLDALVGLLEAAVKQLGERKVTIESAAVALEAAARFMTSVNSNAINLSKGVDFNDIEANADTIDQIFRYLSASPGRAGAIGEDEIVVDVTGGTAIASIAAASMTTMKPSRRFQYVDPHYRVRSYAILHDWCEAFDDDA